MIDDLLTKPGSQFSVDDDPTPYERIPQGEATFLSLETTPGGWVTIAISREGNLITCLAMGRGETEEVAKIACLADFFARGYRPISAPTLH